MSVEAQVAEPALNATPLIDVLLVLLVMLIFTLPIATHAVKLNLPQAPPDPPPRPMNPPPDVYLDILSSGDMLWNGKVIATLEQLSPLLSDIARRDPEPRLKVMPDRRAPYERVAQVLSAAQRAHVDRISVPSIAD
jgi:biopolymer transport protein ExbD